MTWREACYICIDAALSGKRLTPVEFHELEVKARAAPPCVPELIDVLAAAEEWKEKHKEKL